MAIAVESGNLIGMALAGRFDVIAHGCNCKCVMGAGIALAIKAQFPQAHAADAETEAGDREKLGTCTQAHVGGPPAFTIVNAYTQYHWGGADGGADYDAIRSCMAWLRNNHAEARIGLPLIGAGLAKGDWAKIEAIILDELADCDVTIVHFDGSRVG